MFPLVELQTSNKKLSSYDILPENRFLLVFDEEIDSKELIEYTAKQKTKLKQGHIPY